MHGFERFLHHWVGLPAGLSRVGLIGWIFWRSLHERRPPSGPERLLHWAWHGGVARMRVWRPLLARRWSSVLLRLGLDRRRGLPRWGRRLHEGAEHLDNLPLWRHGGVRLAALIVGLIGFGIAATTPLGLIGQGLFFLATWGLALVIRQVPGMVPTIVLVLLSTLASLRYGWWRVSQSLDLTPGWETFFGLGLLVAEGYAWLVMLLGFAQTIWPLRRTPMPLPEDRSDWPLVDVYIPTYNEPLSVLSPTVLAARDLDWPAERLRVYILDDGRRDEMREFAVAAGVGYITRTDNAHAKAGNLNHAMTLTQGRFIAIFDCDHIPVRTFLTTTMGWMLADERCALVQTPHHFFSPDPFERNLGTFRSVPNEGALFYGLVQAGNDMWNAAFFCGSCAVLRRQALEEVGGIAVETVTEDAHTALKMHRLGWKSSYLAIPQAAGLATESLSGHVGQRIRWARGMAQIFRLDNPLTGPGLSLMQRLCYSNAMLHFFYGIPRLVFLTAPLAYLAFGLHIIHAEALMIAVYALPHVILPNITNEHIQEPHRHTFWSEVYEAVLAWYVTLPTTLALLSPRHGKFNVTAKGGLVSHTHVDWQISWPYVLLLSINWLGLALGILRLVDGSLDWLAGRPSENGTVLLNLAWVFYNLVVLGAAMGVARERRQIRTAHRVDARLPVMVKLGDGLWRPAHTTNFSMRGLGLVVPRPAPGADPLLPVAPGDLIQVAMRGPGYEWFFDARVTMHEGIRLGVLFESLSLEDEAALIQCTFSRPGAWIHWSRGREVHDSAMLGIREVLRLSLRSYGLLGYGARARWQAVRDALIGLVRSRGEPR